MNEQYDILESARRSGQPFKMPEGYFETFEDRLMERISVETKQEAPSRRQRIWLVVKPALALAATFALIFGMGYGVLSLTRTLNGGNPVVSGYASVEEELIRPASVMNYYQTGDPADAEEEIDEDTLVSYLATEMSFSDLAEIYAQSFTK
ncbi:MAG: hypothetical protein IKS47_06520 [Bacteroidales bacterium]|nr:hypothetical protein [Bacteroidales bacterium]